MLRAKDLLVAISIFRIQDVHTTTGTLPLVFVVVVRSKKERDELIFLLALSDRTILNLAFIQLVVSEESLVFVEKQ